MRAGSSHIDPNLMMCMLLVRVTLTASSSKCREFRRSVWRLQAEKLERICSCGLWDTIRVAPKWETLIWCGHAYA